MPNHKPSDLTPSIDIPTARHMVALDASQPAIQLLWVPTDTFTRPKDGELHTSVVELLQKATEVAKATGRAYVYPCHLAVAVLSEGEFKRPKKPANLQSRLRFYLSDLLEQAGHSLDTLLCLLWKNVVRLPIQEGYESNEIHESADLIQFLRDFCRGTSYTRDRPLNYLLRDLIKHESLSVAMEDYPLSVREIVASINWLKQHESSNKKIPQRWAVDLTDAEEVSQSPIIGRCDPIKRIIHILSCRYKNMPLLVGKSGVGKTTIARLLAQRVLEGRVPENLNCRIISLTSKGKEDFDDVLNYINLARSDGIRFILFIDDVHELHTLDISRLISEIDANDLHCIGTTNPRRYDDLIKKRGFSDYVSDIQILEPSVPETINILRTLTASLTAYHGSGLCVEDAALHQVVSLAKRFMSSTGALPRSALQVLDQACALVRTQRSHAFESWDYVQSRSVALQVEVAALENATDSVSLIRYLEASSELAGVQDQCSSFENTLAIEFDHKALRRRLESFRKVADDAQQKGNKYLERDIRHGTIPDLEDLCVQDPPSMHVTADVVAKAVSDATGFPVEKLKSTDQDKVLNLDVVLAEEVVGQPEATQAVASAIQLAYSGLTDPCRPVASFLLVGPTGTGKTLLAKTLAKILFDSPEAMIRIDASEYAEGHAISRLIGSPPGYEGHEDGGQLTKHVRQNPYTIVLVDEIEKAARKFVMIFLQVLDDGRLTDGQGETVDFRNTVIIMTSNLGSMHMVNACLADGPVPVSVRSLVTGSIQSHFPPEFINRIDEIIFYRPLSRSNIRAIVDRTLKDYADRLKLRKIHLLLEDCAKDHLADVGYSPIYGARPLKKVMREQILNPLAKMILRGDATNGGAVSIRFDGESGLLVLESSATISL